MGGSSPRQVIQPLLSAPIHGFSPMVCRRLNLAFIFKLSLSGKSEFLRYLVVGGWKIKGKSRFPTAQFLPGVQVAPVLVGESATTRFSVSQTHKEGDWVIPRDNWCLEGRAQSRQQNPFHFTLTVTIFSNSQNGTHATPGCPQWRIAGTPNYSFFCRKWWLQLGYFLFSGFKWGKGKGFSLTLWNLVVFCCFYVLHPCFENKKKKLT